MAYKQDNSELGRLLVEVEDSRRSLPVFGRKPGASGAKSISRQKEAAVTVGGLCVVAIATAVFVVWWRARSRRKQETWDWRHPISSRPDLSRYFIKPPPPKPERTVERLLLGAVVELLKPAVTQILTRKAAGGIAAAVASAAFGQMFGKSKSRKT
jgi:hypothetical protein